MKHFSKSFLLFWLILICHCELFYPAYYFVDRNLIVLFGGGLLQGKVKDIELKGHTDSVDQLCWDPKHPDLIATASGDKTVRLWDARSK